MFWFYLLFVSITIPILIIAPVKVYGRKNFNKKKKHIIVCNHQSNFDGVILDYYLGKRICFIAKKELWGKKGKSFLFDKVLDCIPVDRSKGLTVAATKRVYSLLKENKSLGLFPEGTRVNSEENSEMSVKNGACLFAIKTKTPILPCFIINKQRLFKRNILLVGKPFELIEFYNQKLDKDNLNKASQIVIDKMQELRTEYENFIKEKKLLKQLKKNKAKNK